MNALKRPTASERRGLSMIDSEMTGVADIKRTEDAAGRKDARDIYAGLMWMLRAIKAADTPTPQEPTR